MPKFSIIIPTRQRSDTLRFALQTAVAQDFDDVEILVHESGDDPPTAPQALLGFGLEQITLE